MTEVNRVQYSSGYIFGPATEAYSHPVNMYHSQFFTAAYFTAFVPSNLTAQTTNTALHQNEHSTNSSFQSDSYCRYASDSHRSTRQATGQPPRRPSQCAFINDSPMSQLRLPAIKTSSNAAANVMMEESDLGYSSLSDYSSLDSIPPVDLDTLSVSSGSEEVFDDVKSSFSDIIDDVISNVHTSCEMNNQNEQSVNKTTSDTNSYSHQPAYLSTYEHLRTEHVDDDYASIESSRDVFTQHFLHRVQERNRTVKQNLICVVCDKMFNNKTNLKVHLRMHSNIRPHQCPHCDKSFTQKSTMKTHVRTHTGEKPYVCSHCSRAFSDYSTYRKHQRTHTGEKPYICSVCHKAFAQSGNMIRHKQTHFKNGDILAGFS